MKTVLASVCLGVLLLLCPLRAQARPLRALVRLAQPDDRALLARVRGQTSDLDVRVIALESEPLEARFEDQRESAGRLAAEARAALAIWFVRRAPRLVVYVADLTTDRVLARGIDQGAGLHDASAQEEAAALVVRSAVRASLAGVALDTPAAERVAVAAPPPTPRTESAPQRATPPPGPREEAKPRAATPRLPPPRPATRPRAGAARGRRVEAWLALGAELGRDGFARVARGALVGRAGIVVGRFEAGLGGAFGLAATRAVPVGDATLTRHRLVGFLGFAPLVWPTLRVGLSLEAGAELDVLRVDAAVERFRERGSRSVLALLGAQLSAAYAPRWTRGRAALVPSVGLTTLPVRPVLGYRAEGQFVRVRRLYVVEPVARLSIALRF